MTINSGTVTLYLFTNIDVIVGPKQVENAKQSSNKTQTSF